VVTMANGTRTQTQTRPQQQALDQQPRGTAAMVPAAQQEVEVSFEKYATLRVNHLEPLAAGLVDPKKAIKAAVMAEYVNPKLKNCTNASKFMALVKLTEAGLEPDGVEAALVPYGTKCEAVPMYQGICKLLYSSGMVKAVTAEIVWSNEIAQGRFKYRKGADPWIDHEPLLEHRGNPIGAYAVIQLTTGGVLCDFMNAEELEKIKEKSPGSKRDDSPWRTHPLEMWKKSPLRRISKLGPKSQQLRAALKLLEAQTIETTALPVAPTANAQLAQVARAALAESNEPSREVEGEIVNGDAPTSTPQEDQEFEAGFTPQQ